MRIKKGFNLREITGSNVVFAEGVDNVDFNKIIVLNDSAKFLWNKLQGIDFEKEDVVNFLLEEYDVDKVTASKDVDALLQQFKDANLLED